MPYLVFTIVDAVIVAPEAVPVVGADVGVATRCRAVSVVTALRGELTARDVRNCSRYLETVLSTYLPSSMGNIN